MSKIKLKPVLAIAAIIILGFVAYSQNKVSKKYKRIVEEVKIEKQILKDEIDFINIFDFYPISLAEQEKLKSLSKSQIQQDIFVYLASERKNEGFFVEFGATNGLDLSNSYMLEQNFGWRGILAEPANCWHEKLKNNRPLSKIETACVWKDSGSKLTFNQTDSPELSTVDQYSDHDAHANFRKEGNSKYEVETISLLDLLKKYDAPQLVDYLSIDTEGSELEILEAFFKENNYYKIKIITCEHNYTPNREKIYELLTKHGYQRVYKLASKWDDFFILQD